MISTLNARQTLQSEIDSGYRELVIRLAERDGSGFANETANWSPSDKQKLLDDIEWYQRRTDATALVRRQREAQADKQTLPESIAELKAKLDKLAKPFTEELAAAEETLRQKQSELEREHSAAIAPIQRKLEKATKHAAADIEKLQQALEDAHRDSVGPGQQVLQELQTTAPKWIQGRLRQLEARKRKILTEVEYANAACRDHQFEIDDFNRRQSRFSSPNMFATQIAAATERLDQAKQSLERAERQLAENCRETEEVTNLRLTEAWPVESA